MAGRKVATAVLEITTDVTAVPKGFAEVEKAATRAGKVVESAGQTMSKSFVHLGSLAKTAGAAIAGAFAAGAIINAGKNLIDYAGHVSDLSARLKVSTTEIQHWESAFGPAGVSLETVAKAASVLTEKLASGDKGAVASLKALGISLAELKGLSQEQQLIKVADAIGKLSDQGERVLASKSLFGKGGVEMLAALDGHLQENIDSFDKLGLTLDESTIKAADAFGDQLGLVSKQLMGVVATVIGPLLPALSQLIERLQGFAQWIGQLPEPVKLTGIALATLAVSAGPAALAVKAFAIAVETLTGATALGSLVSGAPGVASAIRSIGTAASGSAVFMGALNAAATGLAIGGFVALASALRDLAIAQGNALAEEKVKRFTEPQKGLNGELRYTTEQAKAAAAALPPLSGAITFAGRRVSEASLGFVDLGKQIAEVEKELAALSATERGQLSKALKSGAVDMEAIHKATGLSAEALNLFKARMDAAATATKSATKDLAALRDVQAKAFLETNGYKDEADAITAPMVHVELMLGKVGQLVRGIEGEVGKAYQALNRLGTVALQISPQLASSLRNVERSVYVDLTKIGEHVDVAASKWLGLQEVLRGIPGTLQRAFEGGGSIVGAFQSIAVQIGQVFITTITQAVQKAVANAKGIVTAANIRAGGAAGAMAGIGSAMSGASGGQSAAAAGMAGASVAVGAISSGASIAGAVALGAATAGIGLAAVGAYFALKKLFSVPKEEKEGRKVSAEFMGQFSSFEEMMARVGDAYRANGKSAADAQKAVSAMLAAEKLGAEATAAAVAKITAELQRQAELESMADEFGPSTDDLKKRSDDLAATVEFMKRSGQYTKEQIDAAAKASAEAYYAWQKQMADSGNEAAKAWIAAHDAAKVGAAAADKTSAALKTLQDELKGIEGSYAGEAVEAEMGHVEREARADAERVKQMIEAMQRQAEAAAAAASQAAEDTTGEASGAADEAGNSIKSSLGELPGAAQAARDAIDRILGGLNYRINVGFNVAGIPVAPMKEGGYGRVYKPTLFYSRGNEDYAFSGEGQTFSGAGTRPPQQSSGDQPGAELPPIHIHNRLLMDGRVVTENVVTRIAQDKYGAGTKTKRALGLTPVMVGV